MLVSETSRWWFEPILQSFMTTKLITKSVPELSERMFKQCLAATMGQRGMMQRRAVALREMDKDMSRVYIVWDSESRQVLSWALLFRWPVEDYAAVSDKWNGYFFTLLAHRRLGYGRQITDLIHKTIDPSEVVVYPWNMESRSFYTETNMKAIGC